MGPLDRAGIYSPDRDDSLLGDGWKWSERHLGKVEHQEDDVILRVEHGSLWFKLQRTNNAKMKLEWAEEYPYAKMVMITYFPEVVKALAAEFMQQRGAESFNTP